MKLKIAVIFLSVIAITTSLIAIFFSLKKETQSQIAITQQTQVSSVSGTFDINGVIPNGASITLTQKERNATQQPNIFASNVPVVDESPWSFTTAETEKSYEIQAQVMVNGIVVATSSPIDVTAPARDEVLVLNIASPKQTATAVISGMIDVDGDIPNGATITINGRKLGEQKFVPVVQGLVGQVRQSMDYTKALSGTTYEVQGVLLDANGYVVGTSDILTVTAPAVDEVLTINSTAHTPSPTPTPAINPITQNTPTAIQPLAPPVSISGNINFNGAAPTNSRIVLFEKQMNAANYQVAVDNIPPSDGVTWQWNSPQDGTWYTIIAILKQRQSDGTDKDIATSTPMTIAAPAASVVMTINSGFSLSAPSGSISVNCQTYNGGPNQNNWNVAITFQSVNGGQSYWYQVGSTNGANDLINTANQTNIVNTVFKNNTTYYARYAYATVPVAPLNSNQYSGFSSTTPLQCSH